MKRAVFLFVVLALSSCAPAPLYQPTPCKQDYDANLARFMPPETAYDIYISCLVDMADEREARRGNR
jgi:hypothetical protein